MCNNRLRAERHAIDFIHKDLILLDTSFQPQADKSVYIYMDAADRCQLWFVLNDRGLYFPAFDELEGLMNYIIDGKDNGICFTLTLKNMEEIDAKL